MKIFNENIASELKIMLGEIPSKVHVAFFGSEKNCRSCKDTEKYIVEFADLHDQIEVELFDIENDKEYAEKLEISKVPAIVIRDAAKNDRGMVFYGIPAGYEVHSLISSIKEAGGVSADLPEDILERIASLDKDVHIQVFVTPTCAYCPGAVITGHRLALLNDKVRADMVESNTFPDESAKYGVKGVPKIIINEEHEFVGSQPITKFLDVIESI